MSPKNKLVRLVFFLPTLLLSLGLYAQPANIVASGVIVGEDGLPVIGAAVYLPDQPTKGTSTDVDGRFSLRVAEGSMLLASSTGYEDVTFKAGPNLKITMKFSGGDRHRRIWRPAEGIRRGCHLPDRQ